MGLRGYIFGGGLLRLSMKTNVLGGGGGFGVLALWCEPLEIFLTGMVNVFPVSSI